eukprot:1968048-Amphidinium_carterae.2
MKPSSQSTPLKYTRSELHFVPYTGAQDPTQSWPNSYEFGREVSRREGAYKGCNPTFEKLENCTCNRG